MRKYSDCQIDYPGVGIITDEQVAKFVKEHTHWWERFDYHTKEELPDREKWYFTDKDCYIMGIN